MELVTEKTKQYLLSVGYPNNEEIYYLDVWLWLWNTKNIQIEVADKSYFAKSKVIGKFFIETNPEEAIAKAIDYLVKNNLIK